MIPDYLPPLTPTAQRLIAEVEAKRLAQEAEHRARWPALADRANSMGYAYAYGSLLATVAQLARELDELRGIA
jgi:hypothetical protein